MILIPEELLHDQKGMEKAFIYYFETVKKECPGTVNAILNMKFEACSFEEKTLTVSMKAEHWMINPNGILHGGISTSMADAVMGVLCRCYSGGKLTPTLNLNVSYLGSVKEGETIWCKACCKKVGRQMANTTSDLWVAGKEDRIAVTASGTYYLQDI